MNMNIKGLEDFKLGMATITLVQQLTITAEVKFKNMQELFHMLRQHGIDVRFFLKKISIWLKCGKVWISFEKDFHSEKSLEQKNY